MTRFEGMRYDTSVTDVSVEYARGSGSTEAYIQLVNKVKSSNSLDQYIADMVKFFSVRAGGLRPSGYRLRVALGGTRCCQTRPCGWGSAVGRALPTRPAPRERLPVEGRMTSLVGMVLGENSMDTLKG